MPFDLETIDSKHIELTNDKGEKVSGMINMLIETAKFYLRSSTKMRDSAAYFLSKLFTPFCVPEVRARTTHCAGSLRTQTLFAELRRLEV